jgi:hypothetical protein
VKFSFRLNIAIVLNLFFGAIFLCAGLILLTGHEENVRCLFGLQKLEGILFAQIFCTFWCLQGTFASLNFDVLFSSELY